MKDIGEMGVFNSIDNQKNKWKVFVLKWYGKPLKIAKKLCPNTVNIINKCNDIHCAMFLILEPGKYIPPHKGLSTACLRYHLGLKIPKDKDNCYIKVNGKKYNWEEGKSLVFDDTYIHSVINNTNESRIILFLDIERPLISPIKEINRSMCKNISIFNFVKYVNDKSEKIINIS
jgi:beta-hydroxylase